MRDVYAWIDPEDAFWVNETREALKMERRAWERCHEERRDLARRVKELESAEKRP